MPVVVAVDAGGTATRARAVRDGAVVFTGRGGPANAISQSARAIEAAFAQALRGCPDVDRVLACVAGGSADTARTRVAAVVRALLPGAAIRVLPGFVGAFHAGAAGTDTCVIAGTGSVVCSPDGAGGWRFTGGRGWLLGDHGSAAHLGKLLVGRYVEDPAAASDAVRSAVERHFGSADPDAVVAAVHSAPAPALLLGALAPDVTALASEGDPGACDVLRRSMARLAGTVATHVGNTGSPRIALSGGVWTSPFAVQVFAEAMAERVPSALVDRSPVYPLDGALDLALRWD